NGSSGPPGAALDMPYTNVNYGVSSNEYSR
ncbi:MAG: hypothetical protein ACI92S_004951, partial [Planctomycetaceae bacterium]